MPTYALPEEVAMTRLKAVFSMIFMLATIAIAGGAPAGEGPGAVRVPEGNGRPILIDGVFTPGEWDDALAIQVRPDLHLLLKKCAGFVFLGLKYSPSCRSVVDLFISPDGKAVTHLHVSAQLGERRLPAPGSAAGPAPFVWGATSDWYANEIRWDAGKVEALMKTGKNRYEAQDVAIYPYDGFEFQIRQSKFGSEAWFIRLETPMPPDGFKVVYPPDTDPASTEGWLKLEIGPSDGRPDRSKRGF
jgi:hypothetical protein